MRIFALLLFPFVVSAQYVATIPATKTSGGGTAPSFINSCAGFTFSTPVTCSLGTVSVNDIIDYQASETVNGATFTPSLTGACAASGGNVTDLAAANQGVAAGTSQKGHLVITTGGSCTISVAFTGAGDGVVSAAVVRSSSGVDVVSADFNPQNNVGTGTNAIKSDTLNTGHTDLCIADTFDAQANAGTLTAGTTIAWTLGSQNTTVGNGNEYFAQTSSGSIQATFTNSTTAYTQTGMTCYKP